MIEKQQQQQQQLISFAIEFELIFIPANLASFKAHCFRIHKETYFEYPSRAFYRHSLVLSSVLSVSISFSQHIFNGNKHLFNVPSVRPTVCCFHRRSSIKQFICIDLLSSWQVSARVSFI